ncbi:hypothetical protein IC582_014029 [Cucumis melo]
MSQKDMGSLERNANAWVAYIQGRKAKGLASKRLASGSMTKEVLAQSDKTMNKEETERCTEKVAWIPNPVM